MVTCGAHNVEYGYQIHFGQAACLRSPTHPISNGWKGWCVPHVNTDTVNMATEVVAAIIATVGVVLSTAVSWVVARSTADVELRKQRLEFFQAYAENLQEHRLAAYSKGFTIPV